MATITDPHPGSEFARLLEARGVDTGAREVSRGAARLLAYWQLAFDEVERNGPKLFAGRFLSVPFERFCERPGTTTARIYQSLGVGMPAISTAHVHPASPGFRARDKRWIPLAQWAGITSMHDYSIHSA